MTDRELLQQALDALENSLGLHINNDQDIEPVIEAIKVRLAQPDADAVAWVNPVTLQDLKDGKEGVHLVYEVEMVGSIPLFEYQPEKEWVGLTSADLIELIAFTSMSIEDAKSVEAKLKEKNK